MAGKFYNVEEGLTLFKNLDADKDNVVPLEEFVVGYLREYEDCAQQLSNAKRVISESDKQKFDFEAKLKESKVSSFYS